MIPQLHTKARERTLIVVGLFFILSGLVLNEKYLAAWFSSDGTLAFPHRVLITIVDLFLISLGFIIIIFRKSFTREKLFFTAGLLFIVAGLLCNERYLAVLLGLEMNPVNTIIVRGFDLYLIGTGSFIAYFRKSVRLDSLFLYGVSTLLSFSLFLLFDMYQAYRMFKPMRQLEQAQSLQNIHVEDNELGWKPKANSVGRHAHSTDFNVTYEIDAMGFKKINNTSNPKFSIYFFGDSFTFGHGVSNGDDFPSLIKDRYLNDDVNVYNAGVMGYGIVQMFQRFLMLEDRIRPGDLVIFTPISEDIERNIKEFYYPYFLSFFCMNLTHYPYYHNGKTTSLKLQKNLWNELKLLALRAPYSGQIWTAIHKKFIPDTRKEAIEMMNIVKERTEAKGGKFCLFFLPETGECLQGQYRIDVSGFDYYDIMHFFPSRKEDLGKLRFKNDRHWNGKGHETAAKAIIETLVDKRVISEEDLKPGVRSRSDLELPTIGSEADAAHPTVSPRGKAGAGLLMDSHHQRRSNRTSSAFAG
jgi:hypothetical protein